jgi:16S rRNA (uracil1498-N3)-methyltransferase
MDDAVAAEKLVVMARFFLPQENIHGQFGAIAGSELDHLRRVLRLKPGDRITVFNERGWEHEAVLRAVGGAAAQIEIIASSQVERESPLQVTLAVGLTKGEKLDWVVEKATELGVAAIVPFASSFAVPKLDERKISARTERWRKIALSATKQSGRLRVPEILPMVAFDELLVQAQPLDARLLCWEKESEKSLRRAHAELDAVRTLLIAVGPEGGLSLGEAEAARRQRFELVHLGRRILRAETAALTALSLVQFLWGDLG